MSVAFFFAEMGSEIVVNAVYQREDCKLMKRTWNEGFPELAYWPQSIQTSGRILTA